MVRVRGKKSPTVARETGSWWQSVPPGTVLPVLNELLPIFSLKRNSGGAAWLACYICIFIVALKWWVVGASSPQIFAWLSGAIGFAALAMKDQLRGKSDSSSRRVGQELRE
jgi:hypothetical protein